MNFSGKKIAIIFWDLGIGGIQTRFVDVINYLLKNTKIEIFLLLKRKLVDEIKPKESSRLKIIYYSNSTREHGEYKSEPIGFGLWLILQLIRIRPNYLLTFLCRYSLIGSIYKLLSFFLFHPVSHTINEGILTSKYLVQHEDWYWKYMVRIFYPMADKIIVPTQAVKKDLMDNFGVFEKKIHVIPSWVEKKQKVVSKKKYDGIFVGRLAPEKGLELLLNLFKNSKEKFPRMSFAIIGDGERRKWLQLQLKKHKLKSVTYLGYKSKDNSLKYIKQSKVLLLPSKNEGLPMVVLEAASVGVPSLATNLPGMNEIIEDKKNGFLCGRNYFKNYFYEIISKKLWIKSGKNSLMHVRDNHSVKNLKSFSELLISI